MQAFKKSPSFSLTSSLKENATVLTS
jgi:hypothetical protein